MNSILYVIYKGINLEFDKGFRHLICEYDSLTAIQFIIKGVHITHVNVVVVGSNTGMK